VHTGHFVSAAGSAAAATIVIWPSASKRHNPAGDRRHASAHLLGHRAKYRQRFNAARHQRGHSAQGGLFGGEPAILGVEVGIVEVLVEFGGKILGGYECVHRILINRLVRSKLCAQFVIVGASCLRVGIDSATC
jgi:hypothetical protein